MFGEASPRLEELARRPYHHTFLLAPDFPFVQDGTRQGEAFRARQDAWYREALAGTPVLEVAGEIDDRVESVVRALSAASDPTPPA